MAIQFLIDLPWCRGDSIWRCTFCNFYKELQMFMRENGGECGNQGGFTARGVMSSWNLVAFWGDIMSNLESFKSCVLEKTETLTARLNWTTEDSVSGKMKCNQHYTPVFLHTNIHRSFLKKIITLLHIHPFDQYFFPLIVPCYPI